jgi:transcriptional regulator with XRE-family HTH domain
MSERSEYLAENIKRLRTVRGLSQAQMAKLVGIPRTTWGHLESSGANPTLEVLLQVSEALHVRLEELIAPTRRPIRLVRAGELPSRKRGEVTIRSLLPDTIAEMDLERMVLPPRARLVGVPHTEGAREYLTCERGQVELVVEGNVFRLEVGDVAVFRGDQKHQYFNPGAAEAIAYSVISFLSTSTR